MFKNNSKLNEIHDYITQQRTEIDQIAELMYHNTESQRDFPTYGHMGLCRQIGIEPTSKASAIIGELERLYKRIYGADYKIKYWNENDAEAPTT